MISRRKFLTLSGAGLGAGLVAGAAGIASGSVFTTDDLELVETPIIIPTLPQEFNGYRIGLLSDLHFGVCIPEDWVLDAIDRLNKSNVDVLIIGGDHLWAPETADKRRYQIVRNPAVYARAPEDRPQFIFERLSFVFSAAKTKDGILAIMGNHEGWLGPSMCRRVMGSRGIQFLINEVKEFRRGQAKLTVLGVDDFWTGSPKLPLPSTFDRAREARIILAHNPDFFSPLIDGGSFEFDLGLAGHTHGGQIILPGIGALNYNVYDERFKSGLFEHPNAQIYTTRGLGVVEIPFRINCRPEVSVLELRGNG